MVNSKEEFRKESKDRISHLEKKEILIKSQGIIENLKSLELINQCQRVGIFIPTPREPQILSWAKSLIDIGIIIYSPTFNQENLTYQFTESSLKGFRKNPHNILECEDCIYEQEVMPEVILVPGQAFDRYGHRIGRGKGHYDTLLSSLKNNPIKIGICFSEQLFSLVPKEDHDIPMDIIVTEKQTYLTGLLLNESF